MFALDQNNIHLASEGGFIYKSTDGTETWVARESGAITATSYSGIHFSDNTYGLAVATAGITALTDDGGLSWTAGGVINAGAAGNLCCHRIDRNKMWVGDDAGSLWYSEDGGTTWTQRTFVGSGAGDVRAIDFINEHVGMMCHNIVAGPVGTIFITIDGGYTWDSITTPTNTGLNACTLVNPYGGYFVGEVQGGLAVVGRVSRSYAVGS